MACALQEKMVMMAVEGVSGTKIALTFKYETEDGVRVPEGG